MRLDDRQSGPPGEVVRGDGAVTQGVAPGDLGERLSMARPALRDSSADRALIGGGQGGGVDDEVLVRPHGSLDETSLEVEEEDHVPPPPRPREGLAHRVGAVVDLDRGNEPGPLPCGEELRPRERTARSDLRARDVDCGIPDGVVDSELARRRDPAVVRVGERGPQPVVVGRSRHVDGPSHGPGAHEARRPECGGDLGHRGALRPRDEGVRNRRDLLALEGEEAGGRLLDQDRASRGDEPLRDDPQKAEARGQRCDGH